ncbi:phage integrase central domain-containing protein [Cupriavidus malaysiensis]|uniref:phage integrase central domain-containing protein n=1 Tax=Cupriavidus malaysiensis TaxID=367825 RepID=UPI000AA31D79|nr:hypothetical protein [Cupriavidus malaysiensis]
MIGRRKKASPLPSRVYEKNGAWYFVDIRRKWHKLCRVSEGLTALYTALANFSRDADDRPTDTMPALIDAWLLARLSKYSPKTQEEYRRMATFIKAEFDGQWRVEDVEPKDVARFLDKHFEAKPNASNKYRALLSVMFTFAVRKGLRNANPVSEVAGATEKKRDRYITDAELDAVRAAALVGNDDKPTPSGRAIVVGRKVIMSHFARSKSEPPFSTVSLLRAKAGDAPEGTVDANPCAQSPRRIGARDRAAPGYFSQHGGAVPVGRGRAALQAA